MGSLREHSPIIFTIFGLQLHLLILGLALTDFSGGSLSTRYEIGPIWALGSQLVNAWHMQQQADIIAQANSIRLNLGTNEILTGRLS
jgi:hypothetical protein